MSNQNHQQPHDNNERIIRGSLREDQWTEEKERLEERLQEERTEKKMLKKEKEKLEQENEELLKEKERDRGAVLL